MNGSKQSGMTIKPIVVLLVGLVLASVQPAEAQQSGKVARIGFLDNSTASGIAVFLDAFRQEDAIPRLARVGLLRLPGAGIQELQLKELRAAAPALKLKLEEIETQPDAKGLESAFQTARQKQVGAIMTATGRRFFAERKRVVELAVKYRLPAIYPEKGYVDEGGLMSYGADYDDLYRKAAF
jgi:putative tryptophan/tyrosine transport system substrate-binding protein